MTVVEPRFVAGLADERAAFREAVRRPIGARPLREIVQATDRVAVVIPDLTRPLPSDRLLPWLFEELAHVPPERFIDRQRHGLAPGQHARRARGRWSGADVLARYRWSTTPRTTPPRCSRRARRATARPVLLNREYVEADRRIVLGFVEPHFMAGFSGGYKGIFPAVADIASIMRYHDAKTIGDPRSTWGLLEGNPTQAIIRHNGSLLPLDFCLNVTLNRKREITRFFCGDPLAAHEAGCAFSKATAMVACERPFPIVVTTNSGLPARPEPLPDGQGHVGGGPDRGAGRLHRDRRRGATTASPSTATSRSCSSTTPRRGRCSTRSRRPGFSLYDQWEAQLLALIRLKARVGLLSELPADEVRRAHLEPIADVGAAVAARAGAGSGRTRRWPFCRRGRRRYPT